MYLNHFGLREAPFRITPNTEFFFDGAKRGATLDALVHAVTHDEGIVRVSGEVGSGKTMLCRMLAERLPEHVETVYIANPNLSRDEIVMAIADELRVSLPSERPSSVIRALQDKLIALHAQGRQVVVLVDEAHAMPPETLEEIRLLSNLETRRAKLLQIVLFGQPELAEVLESPRMRQLKDRITHHFALEPLIRADVSAYLDFRLRAAGYRGPPLFTAGATKVIAAASGGLTRRINVLADKSLLAAFAASVHQIDARHARLAVRDTDLTKPRAKAWRHVAWAAAVVAAAGVAAGIWVYRSTALTSITLFRGAAAPRPISPVPAPTEQSESPSAPTRPGPTPAVANPVLPSSGGNPPSPAEPADPTPRVETAPSAPEHAPASPAPTVSPRDAPAAATVPAEGSPSDAVHAGRKAKPLGPRSEALLSRTNDWLMATPDDHWVIQVLSANAGRVEELEDFVVRATQLVDQSQMRIADKKIGGVRRLAVIYGDYNDLHAANAALARLPSPLRAHGAFPQQVGRLKP